ncbi:MAG: Jag N-terminal domain-containing protein [Chloroflexi bacterium]|nr:Jag N-terminal domain-containing protein [Chloroflexota bacterium]
MRQVDIQARSVDDAVALALEQLGRSRDEVKVEVLATDPGGEEVLVRVTASDRGGAQPQEEISPRIRRPQTGPNRRNDYVERGKRSERVERAPMGGSGFSRSAQPGSQLTRPIGDEDIEEIEEDNYGNRIEPAEAPVEVLLDSSLQTAPLAAGEHATPQDAVAPVAAEVLQKILVGMKVRGRIVRREANEGADAAFADDAESVLLNVVGLNERDQNNLIGRRGETLDALQFLTNLIVGRQVDLWARIIVDVEGYRLRRKLALVNLARRTADQVENRKQAIPLEAMPAYERRIIHMTLQEHPAVTTESSGAEPERRVVVLPK